MCVGHGVSACAERGRGCKEDCDIGNDTDGQDTLIMGIVKRGLFIRIISHAHPWGTLKREQNPECAVYAVNSLDCAERRDNGPAAGLQVSPTSDSCQSVAILMNRHH